MPVGVVGSRQPSGLLGRASNFLESTPRRFAARDNPPLDMWTRCQVVVSCGENEVAAWLDAVFGLHRFQKLDVRLLYNLQHDNDKRGI